MTGQPCIAAEQESSTGESSTGDSSTGESSTGDSSTGESSTGESSTGEPAELVISTLQSVPQAVERDGSICVQTPVAETDRDAVAELAL